MNRLPVNEDETPFTFRVFSARPILISHDFLSAHFVMLSQIEIVIELSYGMLYIPTSERIFMC